MTNTLNLLRKLAEHQQYSELRETALSLWHDTQIAEILPLLALAYAHAGQRHLAVTTLKQFMQSQGKAPLAAIDTDVLLDIAAAHIVLQQTDEARTFLKAALQQQPDHALGLARLAYCALLEQDLDQAQTLFEQSLAIDPGRIAVINNLASIHLLQNDFAAAQARIIAAQDALAVNQAQLPEPVLAHHEQLQQALQFELWIATEAFAKSEECLQARYSLQQAEALPADYVITPLLQYARLLAERNYHSQASDILRQYLQHFPDNSDLCLKLSELAQVQGQFLPAVRLMQRAIKQDKENSSLWAQLSSACLHRFDKQARHAAEKAVELAASLIESDDLPLAVMRHKQAEARHALATVESHEQHFEQADALFREILAEHEYFLPALQGLGQQQMQRGQIDEALELFERVKQIDPIKGYSALINARRFPEDEATLEKMEAAAARPSLEGKVRSGILFQLAAAWEKRQDYDKAFDLAQRANEASKHFLSYDAKAHRNQCFRTRYCFSKALYEHRPDCGIDSSLPVFVVGMPRSGTTLVEQILSGHSQIFGAGELGIIPQVIQGLNRWERHTGSGRRYPDCTDDLNAQTTAGIANNVLKELQEYDPEVRHIVDKLPHNFENIGLIKFLFPRAKIISVRRDPRDIAISNYFTDYQAKHGGMGFAYDLQAIGEQLADHNLLMHHWQQVFPGEILEVNYEDVVDDTEGSARKMLAYIGVDWEPAVLKFNELERPVKTASVWQVRQPIYKTAKAKWRRYEKHLAPLIKGTNAKIQPDPITDMVTLPEPGFLTDGVALYKKGDLDEAERCFKKMLHHIPEHGACHYMLGLVYLCKHHAKDGIAHLEKALEKAPWQRTWRENLAKAYRQEGEDAKAQALEQKVPGRASSAAARNKESDADLNAIIEDDDNFGHVTSLSSNPY